MRLLEQPEVHFLLSDAYALLETSIKLHPILGSALLVLLFGIIVGILKKIFGRITGDIILFALIIWAITLAFGSTAFIFFGPKGFH